MLFKTDFKQICRASIVSNQNIFVREHSAKCTKWHFLYSSINSDEVLLGPMPKPTIFEGNISGTFRNSFLELFLGIEVMKTSQTYTTPVPKCNFNNFIETTLQHGYSPVNLLHIFRAPFLRTTMEGYS